MSPHPNPNNADLGRAIRRRRRRARLTIDDLAGEARMHPTYLSGIERGIRNPTFDKIIAVAEGLDVPLSEIVEDATTESEIAARMREIHAEMRVSR
jgi:transcriptional regulator with XRE-family HTH domain